MRRPLFETRGTLRRGLRLEYRTPADSLGAILPAGLELVRRGDYGFWSVMFVEVEPDAGITEPVDTTLGHRGCHAVYALRVQAMTAGCDIDRGLHIVRHDIGQRQNDVTQFVFKDGRADAELQVSEGRPAHRFTSCFPTATDAHQNLPLTTRLLSRRGSMLRAGGFFPRSGRWEESPVTVASARLGFFDSIGQRDLHLELATRIAPTVFSWRPGTAERLLETAAAVPHGPAMKGSGKQSAVA